jgi:integrase
MERLMSTTRYQEGSIERVKRAKGPVWVFRWRELQEDGRRLQRKKVIGDLERYPNKAAAKKAVENLRLEINARQDRVGRITVEELWGHFQTHELRNPVADRSPVTIETYLDNFRLYITPQWGKKYLDEVKAVQVEKWLGSLLSKENKPLAPATKSKIRNQMSCLYSHAIRHELWDRLNPISSVRQSSKRLLIPDILSLPEMQAILAKLNHPMHRIAILIAAVTGLRRSEIRGLKWADVDLERRWLHLRRGIVRTLHTKLKTEGSRRGVPIPQDLCDALVDWRDQSLYRGDDDWVLASPTTNGRNPIWLDIVLRNYIVPAAKEAGITKRIGWHTWRRSLASLLAAKGEKVKVVQELLRHSNATITMELYQQADADAKRAAQEHTKSLFLVRRAG